MDKAKEFTIAVVGNPNCGKTCIFNALTGSKQHVGNWAGVTVEIKEGFANIEGKTVKIVDLPGTYSLGAYSEDEAIAVRYIVEEKPDAVINVIDSANIERNLYLTVQLLELRANIIIALNMTDEAEKRNIRIFKEKLSSILSVPVVSTVAIRNKGIKELLAEAVRVSNTGKDKKFLPSYGEVVEEEVHKLRELLSGTELEDYPPRWLALRLLENDQYVLRKISNLNNYDSLSGQLKASCQRINDLMGCEAEAYIIDKRYEIIRDIVKQCVEMDHTSQETITDKIDRIVTNKWLGLPIFGLIMFLMYQITMGFGNDFLGQYVDSFFIVLGEYTAELMKNSPPLLTSFIVDGLIGGLGSVLVFVPLMFTLYFLVSLLEDSGYMARAAFVMDRMMSALGLHGKTAVSMIISSGCNVAGILSARTLENRKDRLVSILISPFISCSARLPVYALFASAFFGDKKAGVFSVSGLVIFSLYVLGIVVAVVIGKIFSKTLLKEEKSYFVMELPPYRLPTLKGLFIHMWEKTEAFIKKAGTVIFGIIILLWTFSMLPMGVEPGSSESIIGQIGQLIAPIFKPAGFGSWEAGVALITGIGAKEAIVATFGMVYSTADDSLAAVLQQHFTPLSAYAFMVMTLLYMPCAATLAVIRRETNSPKWTLFSAFYSFVTGWTGAVLVYQIGRLFGLE